MWCQGGWKVANFGQGISTGGRAGKSACCMARGRRTTTGGEDQPRTSWLRLFRGPLLQCAIRPSLFQKNIQSGNNSNHDKDDPRPPPTNLETREGGKEAAGKPNRREEENCTESTTRDLARTSLLQPPHNTTKRKTLLSCRHIGYRRRTASRDRANRKSTWPFRE